MHVSGVQAVSPALRPRRLLDRSAVHTFVCTVRCFPRESAGTTTDIGCASIQNKDLPACTLTHFIGAMVFSCYCVNHSLCQHRDWALIKALLSLVSVNASVASSARFSSSHVGQHGQNYLHADLRCMFHDCVSARLQLQYFRKSIIGKRFVLWLSSYDYYITKHAHVLHAQLSMVPSIARYSTICGVPT